MKTKLTFLLGLPLAAGCLPAFAQGTAFTYQGRLNDDANPATGIYDLRFTIYDLATGGSQQGNILTNPATAISNGLFTVTLDFGNQFPGGDRWLEIGVRTNGGGAFTSLSPRQPLTPTPYAITAANVISNGLAAGTYGSAVNFTNAANVFDGSFYGQFFGGSFNGNFAGTGSGLGDVWHTGGNLGTTPANFLGTTDQQPLELRANSQRILRLEPDNRGLFAGNLIGGYIYNQIQGPGTGGAVIAGGGWSGGTNVISFGANGSFIGAGSGHLISAGSSDAFIGGGSYNLIRSNSYLSVIGGGDHNSIGAPWAVTAGGYFNTNNGWVGFIGAGDFNSIETNGSYAVIGGGYLNYNNGYASTLGGGIYNSLRSDYALIGGGYNNLIQSNAPTATIVGGHDNAIQSAAYAIIGGGGYHVIQPGAYDGVIGGGGYNTIQVNAYRSAIGGGAGNTIQSNAYYGAIAGGGANTIGTNANSATIGGGYFNGIGDGANTATVAGGNGNFILAGSGGSFIGGGIGNNIGTNSAVATIAGGNYNFILDNNWQAAIGGGLFNTNGGFAATIPGGYQNVADADFSFAAGQRAKSLHQGSFVWADSQTTDFVSTTPNQFNVRASGGVRFVTGGAGMTLDGQPVFAGLNGSNLTGVDAATLGGVSSSGFWKTTGNAGTTPGANFIGTTDGARLLIKGSFVGVGRAAQITSAEYFGIDAPVGSGAFGGMYINTTNANGLPFYGYALGGFASAYHFLDGNDGNKWKLYNSGVRLTVMPGGNVGIGTTTPTNTLHVNGGVSATAFVNTSDRNAKENFQTVSPREVLDKVAALPITTWNYKDMHDGRHMGPVAQDFYAAFGLGGSDKTITSIDPDGVALAAIQGLNQKLEEKDSQIRSLKSELEQLKEMVNKLANTKE